MMNGVGIWDIVAYDEWCGYLDIVAYVQKRAVVQTRSIDKMHISFSVNGSHILCGICEPYSIRLAPSHIRYSSIVNQGSGLVTRGSTCAYNQGSDLCL